MPWLCSLPNTVGTSRGKIEVKCTYSISFVERCIIPSHLWTQNVPLPAHSEREQELPGPIHILRWKCICLGITSLDGCGSLSREDWPPRLCWEWCEDWVNHLELADSGISRPHVKAWSQPVNIPMLEGI